MEIDAVGRKIKRERKRKYKLLKKFRKARDIASKHLNKSYSCICLFNKINNDDELYWIERHSKNDIAIKMYEWAKRTRE